MPAASNASSLYKAEIVKLTKENDSLRKQLQQQIALTEEFKNKCNAMMKNSTLRQQAKFAAIQEVNASSEAKQAVCLKVWNIMQTQVMWQNEFIVSTTFHTWFLVTQEQLQKTSLKESRIHKKNFNLVTLLREV